MFRESADGAPFYDAFNRPVEVQGSGGTREIVYAPDGYKFALMNGQSVVKVMAPLAAGIQAVYTAYGANGLAYWRHADWLGSSRLASTIGRTVLYDGAYAPFGEPYTEPPPSHRPQLYRADAGHGERHL